MRVELLVPDVKPFAPSDAAPAASGGAFAQALDAVSQALDGAQRAEDAFASGSGTLQSAVYERARADVALSVATAAAQRTAQALTSILNMGV